jgi:hypothetical protein
MFARLRLRSFGSAIVALYVLAAVMAGAAHRPLTVPSWVDPAAAAYALPDGTTPVICAVDEGRSDPHHAVAACDACLLASAPGLPAPGGFVLPPSGGRSVQAPLPEAQLSDLPARHAPVSRGPPASA